MTWQQGRSGVQMDTWVSMKQDVPMEYEVNSDQTVTLFFGRDRDYTLVLSRENLAQLLSLGNEALAASDTGP